MIDFSFIGWLQSQLQCSLQPCLEEVVLQEVKVFLQIADSFFENFTPTEGEVDLNSGFSVDLLSQVLVSYLQLCVKTILGLVKF